MLLEQRDSIFDFIRLLLKNELVAFGYIFAYVSALKVWKLFLGQRYSFFLNLLQTTLNNLVWTSGIIFVLIFALHAFFQLNFIYFINFQWIFWTLITLFGHVVKLELLLLLLFRLRRKQRGLLESVGFLIVVIYGVLLLKSFVFVINLHGMLFD